MFSIKESLKYGWEKFKIEKAVWAVTLAMGILYLLSSGGSGNKPFSYGLISLLAFVAILIARIGYTKILLKIADGEHYEWPKALEDLLNTHKVFWKFFWTAVLFGLFTILGFILLIIPGFIIISMYAFSQLIVVDLGLGPIAAMKESKAITKGSRMKILGFLIVLGVLNILGVIALGIGLFITIPVSMFAMINVYRKLSANKLGVSTT